MKFLGNSSDGYQIIKRSKRFLTKLLWSEKTRKAFSEKKFTMLDTINNHLNEVDLAKSEIEHREPIIVIIFILQYRKLRMLELSYNFFAKNCEVQKFEETHMDISLQSSG